MNLTQQNVKRLASISAFGAGVLAVAPPAAEAGIVTISPNVTVGFSGPASASYVVDVPGIRDFVLARSSSTSSGTYRVLFRSPLASSFVQFATVGADRLRAFPAGGGKWSVVGGARSEFGFVATHAGGNSTQMTPTNKFFLFRFTDSTAGNAFRYGWGELSVSFPGNKPDVTLARYAFDDTGAQILAGDVGSVPEPSSLALTGLGALAIGARALRRWRASRSRA